MTHICEEGALGPIRSFCSFLRFEQALLAFAQFAGPDLDGGDQLSFASLELPESPSNQSRNGHDAARCIDKIHPHRPIPWRLYADGQCKLPAVGPVTIPRNDVEPVPTFAQRARLPDRLGKERCPIRVDAFQPGSESHLFGTRERVGRKTDSEISFGEW